MKKFMSAIIMLAMLLSLGGCFFPHPWHDGGGGHGRGHGNGGYKHHLGGGQNHEWDGDRYERR